MKFSKIIICVLFLVFLFSVKGWAENDSSDNDDDEDSARIYRSPEERREEREEEGTELNDWLTFSGSLEIEKEYSEENFNNGKKDRIYEDAVPTLQFALEFSFSEWLGAELVYELEYDEDQEDGKWDEAFVSFDFEDVGLGVEVGRVSVPFGEYYSYFVTDPLLEFSETTKNGLLVEYSIFDSLEITAFAIDSDVHKQSKSNEYDWGGLIEYVSSNESIRIGLSYLSDLAESDEEFLRDEGNIYQKRVAAWNAYALFGFENFEVTAEMTQATSRFREFDKQEDKPEAYNIEVAYFPKPNLLFAIRYEGSDEFSEEPEEQYGVHVTWQPADRISFSLDYLHGDYKNNSVLDDDDNDDDDEDEGRLEDRDIVAVEFSVDF